MSEILTQPVIDESAWTASALAADGSWIYKLSDEENADLEMAFQLAKRNHRDYTNITKEDFPLASLGGKLLEIQHYLDECRGIFLLRGIPVERYTLDEIQLIYAGIASHMGVLIVQDTKGTLIDHVYDRGLSYDNIAVRGYTTNAELTPHCDSGDIVMLLCVRPAKSGGENSFVSSMTIYNEILKQHPEFLDPLYKGFHYNIRGNGPPGEFVDITQHRVPVYSYHDQKLSCRYNQKAIKTAEQLMGVQPITELEKNAIDYITELANRKDFRYDLTLASGDIVFLNNHLVLHTRSAFEDYVEADRKRLLLRLWVNLHQARQLTWEFADHYNTGPRQGPFVRESTIS